MITLLPSYDVTPASLAASALPPLRGPLTMLASGLGQDSAALLALATHDPSFAQRFIRCELICVNANTDLEHRDTEAYVPEFARQCADHAIPFYRVGAPWRSNAWRDGMLEHLRRHQAVNMRTMRSCTDNLKLVPQYHFLDAYLGLRLGVESGRKRALRAYAQRYGKLRVIIGFAKGEERRARRADEALQLTLSLDVKTPRREPAWMTECIERVYPLIDLGMDRADCQRYVTSCGLPCPPPSNCYVCHHKTPPECLWTSLVYPDEFAQWCQLEENKLRAWDGRTPKNHGVYGSKRLPEVVADARAALLAELGPVTDAQLVAHLDRMRFTRGHCVNSAM